MARVPLIRTERPAAPKIIVVGQSVVRGRMPTLLRIRPTLVQRIKRVSVGPMYLIIEHALEELLAKVERKGSPVVQVPGYQMTPTQEDEDMLASARQLRDALDENESKGPTTLSAKAAAAAKKAADRKAVAKASRKAAKTA